MIAVSFSCSFTFLIIKVNHTVSVGLFQCLQGVSPRKESNYVKQKSREVYASLLPCVLATITFISLIYLFTEYS